MGKRTFINILVAACALLNSQACAHWSWLDDAKDFGDKAQELGKQAWDEAKKQWDALDINQMLQQAFGSEVDENSALVGRFYDLKQPIDGKSKPLHRHEVVAKFRQFNNQKWDRELFNGYYSPKVKLYAPYFYLPRCKADYGPEAFQCNNDPEKPNVKPSDWVVVYRGVVTAPKSGTFRFAGMGDDVLMVRFDNKLVLESGWSIPTRNSMTLGTNKGYQRELTGKLGCALYRYDTTPHWNEMLGGIPTGIPFKVRKGKKYPIEILVSEIPGNEFGFCLLVEELHKGKKVPTGTVDIGKAPVLHLFRTNDSLPDPARIRSALTTFTTDYTVNGSMEGPPFRSNSLIWQADYQEAQERGLFDRMFGQITGKDKDTAMGTSHKEDDDSPEHKEQDNSTGLWDSLFD